MKKLMYIFFALPILTGCKEKKSAGAMGGMPTPENTLLATVYIPNFYELMQKLQEKFSKKKGNNDKQEGSM